MARRTLSLPVEELLTGGDIAGGLCVERRYIERTNPRGEQLKLVAGQWKSGHSSAGAILNEVCDLTFAPAPQSAIVGQSRRSVAPSAAFTVTTAAKLVELL